jgi:hypothetical protein
MKMLSIRLRNWDLLAFFIWLTFEFQLFAFPTGHTIMALKCLGKAKVYPKQATNAHRHRICTAVLCLTSALDGMGQLCYTKGLIKTQKSKFNFRTTDSSILHFQLPAVCTVYIIWYLKCKTVQSLLVCLLV